MALLWIGSIMLKFTTVAAAKTAERLIVGFIDKCTYTDEEVKAKANGESKDLSDAEKSDLKGGLKQAQERVDVIAGGDQRKAKPGPEVSNRNRPAAKRNANTSPTESRPCD